MKARPILSKFAVSVLLILAAVSDAQVLKGFRFPEYDEKGQLKYEITGDEAQVQPDGLIQIRNLKMTFYEQGKVLMQVTTPQCLFDRVKRLATSKAAVFMERPGIKLSGQGFTYDAQAGRLEIFQDVRLVLRSTGGKAPGGGGS
ncbi:MAG: LPS export ABC transporter periplasmic protein LptC [Lentisphaerae bacterium]|nr:LPS export ABC transporter periplasmic protein LptC [Lentisphaerota bacterium]